MASLLSIFLKSCSIRHTRRFADSLYYSHPNRNNLLGLKQMLEIYNLKTQGVKYENKLSAELSFPCILHITETFVIGTDLNNDTITYLYEGKEIQKSVTEFCNIWSGVALLPTSCFKNALEPDYTIHKKKSIQLFLSNLLLVSLPIIIWILLLINHFSQISLHWGIGCSFDFIGLLLSYFLMEKQLFKNSQYGDKVCSAFHLNNCNDILFSEKSKFGVFSWCEIGLGYFIGRLLCHNILPEAVLPLSMIGWTAMLYGIWSIWQQAKVLHKFCLLCTLVQFVIWINGIIDIFFISNYTMSPYKFLLHSLTSGCIILLCIIVIHFIASNYTNEQKHRETKWIFNAFKADPDVFWTKLYKNDFYATTCEDSHILFGNINSKIRITILTNPHCNPCAKMHKRIDALMKRIGSKVCIQYIFSAFNEKLEDSNRFLISSYLQLNRDSSQKIFKEWYDGKKYNAQEYISANPVDLYTHETKEEIQRHREWRDKNGITATPTVLINGYRLPEEYEIEDLPIILE